MKRNQNSTKRANTYFSETPALYRTIQKPCKPLPPTEDQYHSLESAFNYFNDVLFQGSLPPCILNFDRRVGACGGFKIDAWEKKQEMCDELKHEVSINPKFLKGTDKQIMAVLVHTMSHLFQFEFGSPSRAFYHNREFALIMDSIGLPTQGFNCANEIRTGQNVSCDILTGGLFDLAFDSMPSEYLLPWKINSLYSKNDNDSKISVGKNKVTYFCSCCDSRVWGKPGLTIFCGDCNTVFLSM